MHLTVSTTAGKLEYDVAAADVPAGYNAEKIAHTFADVIDGNTTARQIVQHTAPKVWTAINHAHVVAVDVAEE